MYTSSFSAYKPPLHKNRFVKFHVIFCYMPPLDMVHCVYVDITWCHPPPLSVPVSGSFNIRSCKPPLSSCILPSSTMNLSHFQLLIISFSCLNFISFPPLHLPHRSLSPELLPTFPSSVPFQISSPHLLWFHVLLSSRISLVYSATIRLYENIK